MSNPFLQLAPCVLVLTLVLILVSGCTTLVGDDTNLSVVTEPDVTQCLPRGSVHVLLTTQESDESTGQDAADAKARLMSLALEKAVPFGGDTVVPAGPLDSNGQFFNVYRCRDLQRTEPPVISVEVEKPD